MHERNLKINFGANIPMKRVMRVCVFGLVGFLTFSFGAEFELKNLKSLEADFVQVVSTQEEMTLSYSGKLQAKAPNKAKWSYEPPMQKEVFVNDKELIVYEPALQQAHIQSLVAQQDFFEILSKAEKVEGKKRLRAEIDGIIYNIFLDSKGLPKRIEYSDNLENTTIITLENVKINPKIADSVFVFVVPKGIDILRH